MNSPRWSSARVFLLKSKGRCLLNIASCRTGDTVLYSAVSPVFGESIHLGKE
jgi:hypothetical protein